MALVKTYLLAPNFNFRPDGPIALGNIIADPFRPHRVLAKADPSAVQPEIETVFEDDFVAHRSAGHGINVSIWAQFLASLGINLGTNFSQNTSTTYSMSSLKTVYLKSGPSDEELRQRANVPKVRNALRTGLRSRPVYMVSGIKIAENLTVATERGVHKGINAGVSAPVAEGISLGGNVELTREKGQQDSSRARQDVVFAYELLVIRLRGGDEETPVVNEFHSKAAFLGDKAENDADIEVEAVSVTAPNLLALERKDVPINSVDINMPEGSCICISFPDSQA